MKLSLGFSPCPNDTFIFDALVNGHINTRGITFNYVMEDVATLNQWAESGKLDVTKLSYSTFLKTFSHYGLMHSGSALGEGVGPLLVATKPYAPDEISKLRIAIPGVNTTANLLLSLSHPDAVNKTEMLFNEVEQAVLTGKFDAGLLIHEGRFTYERKGLVKLMDLGDWWEQSSGTPIPLGGIVARRSLGAALCSTLDEILRESISWAWNRYPALSDFITCNAQEMEQDVMRQHINLYVNGYTNDLGETGTKAIKTLFDKAIAAGLVANSNISIFYK